MTEFRPNAWLRAAWFMLAGVAVMLGCSYLAGLIGVFGAHDMPFWFKSFLATGLVLVAGACTIMLTIAIRDRVADSRSNRYDQVED